jgi:hypothetical protein
MVEDLNEGELREPNFERTDGSPGRGTRPFLFWRISTTDFP